MNIYFCLVINVKESTVEIYYQNGFLKVDEKIYLTIMFENTFKDAVCLNSDEIDKIASSLCKL